MSIPLPPVTAPAARASARCAIIGLSTSEMRAPERVRHDPHSEPAGRELALNLTYPEAIRRAGAIPIVIPPLDAPAIEPLLDGLWGLCLSGGPDLQPSYYGAQPHRALGPTEPHLDAFEITLVRAAEAREMPVLAICRGLQVLNVARGGTLHQHVEGHRQAELASVPTHAVEIALHSATGRITGATRLEVNSFHHQAVDDLGDGLCVAARAHDGTVEAIECREHPFLVGVQWHAETLVDHAAHRSLFRALVRAAAGSSGARGVPLRRAA